MRRAEIKVGETYGVRFKRFGEGYGHDPVPAKVVALDEPIEWASPGYTNIGNHRVGGGVRVRFVNPTRVGYSGFSLVSKTNANGDVQEEFVFHDDLPGCGGSVGKCFVGVWSEMEAERKAENRAEKDARAARARKADEFAVTLAAYRERLAKLGLSTELHGDGSGLHGDVQVSLYTTGYGEGNRPTGFAYGEVGVSRVIFDRLVEIAERHGETVDTRVGDEDDDEE